MPKIGNQRVYHDTYGTDIALVHLVEPVVGTPKYRYIATRLYNSRADTLDDVALTVASDEYVQPIAQAKLCIPSAHATRENFYAAWEQLPLLNVQTKRLVGRNKKRYYTIVSARVNNLGIASKCSKAYGYKYETPKGEVELLQVLGYTFMTVNGDKIYLTAKQIRDGDILNHVHSVQTVSNGGMYQRLVGMGRAALTEWLPDIETAELDADESTDEEIAEIQAYQALVGNWYAKGSDGALLVDKEALQRIQPKELVIPEGFRSIPQCAFDSLEELPHIKRIKLPETLRTIGDQAFAGLQDLEEINIPKSVEYIGDQAFCRCNKLKELDLTCVQLFGAAPLFGAQIDRLVLPDTIPNSVVLSGAQINVLEFRNTSNAKQRVLRTVDVYRNTGHIALVNRIETNGPVVLGNCGLGGIDCIDASAIEPNIIGIKMGSQFIKCAADGTWQPWELGGDVEYVYSTWAQYRFKEEAYTRGNLKAAIYRDDYPCIEMPKSVELLRGTLPLGMTEQEFPNVVFASQGLLGAAPMLSPTSIRHKMPSLRWITPAHTNTTLEQNRLLERKLKPYLAELCVKMQKEVYQALSLDLYDPAARWELQRRYLCADASIDRLQVLYRKYGMVYVGDYSALLEGKLRCL